VTRKQLKENVKAQYKYRRKSYHKNYYKMVV